MCLYPITLDVKFGKLINSIREKLQIRGSKLLSFAGRIKLVLTIITSKVRLWLQTFQIPSCSIAKIIAMCAYFISSGGLHKASCKELCQPKKEGGVGLFELKAVYGFKLAWKIIESNNL